MEPIAEKNACLDFAVRSLERVPTRAETLKLSAYSTQTLVAAAKEATIKFADRVFNFCGIINAKSGRCSEDCAWCSQSRRFVTGIPIYPLINADKALEAAKQAQANGLTRFSLVTSGRKLSAREVRETIELVRVIRKETNLQMCLSAGLLTEKELQSLFEAGVVRYHCNLESSESHFGKLCSTHTTADKVKTLMNARAVGMDVCSGGIIGMGAVSYTHLTLPTTSRV